VPQPILRTPRLLLVPLADRHLDLEVELDSDPEVMRYLDGRARTPDEVAESHARRMAHGRQVPGLGYWIVFTPRTEQPGNFVGLMMLPPAHDPDQPDDPSVIWATGSSAGTGARGSRRRRRALCYGTRSPRSASAG